MIKKLSRIGIRTMPTHLNHIHILYGYIIQRNSLYTRNTIQRKTEKAKPVTSNKDYDTIEKIIKNRQIQIQTQKNVYRYAYIDNGWKNWNLTKILSGVGHWFKLAKTATSVTNRRNYTCHSQRSNKYNAIDGINLMQIQKTGHDWLDPSTFRIMFDLSNNGSAGQWLRPLEGPWSSVSRMRICAGGQILDDIEL